MVCFFLQLFGLPSSVSRALQSSLFGSLLGAGFPAQGRAPAYDPSCRTPKLWCPGSGLVSVLARAEQSLFYPAWDAPGEGWLPTAAPTSICPRFLLELGFHTNSSSSRRVFLADIPLVERFTFEAVVELSSVGYFLWTPRPQPGSWLSGFARSASVCCKQPVLGGFAGLRVFWGHQFPSRRPSGLRKTIADGNSLAHRTTWLHRLSPSCYTITVVSV